MTIVRAVSRQPAEITDAPAAGALPHPPPSDRLAFKLTERDLAILQAVNRHRYLKTSQIKRLLFPEAATLQTTRRRLQKLAHPGWRYLQHIGGDHSGEGRPESAYALGKEGVALLEAMGDAIVPYPRSPPRRERRHFFLEHALAISHFRISLELALQEHPLVRLQRFVHEDELKTHLRRGIKKDAYKLYHRFPRPGGRRQDYVVHPDALFVLAATSLANEQKQRRQRLYFLEVDRGTEALRVLWEDKVPGYQLFRENRIFLKFGDFRDFLVLIVTNSERRARNLREALTDVPGAADTWVAADTEITEATVLSGAVWLDHEGQRQAILRA